MKRGLAGTAFVCFHHIAIYDFYRVASRRKRLTPYWLIGYMRLRLCRLQVEYARNWRL